MRVRYSASPLANDHRRHGRAARPHDRNRLDDQRRDVARLLWRAWPPILCDAPRSLMFTVRCQHLQVGIFQHIDAAREPARVSGLCESRITWRCHRIAALDALGVRTYQHGVTIDCPLNRSGPQPGASRPKFFVLSEVQILKAIVSRICGIGSPETGRPCSADKQCITRMYVVDRKSLT